jgi:ubiquinone/menaquinone biosynthesis C-methylase UbiE
LDSGASILDVGGGHAQLAPALLKAGMDVVVYGSPEASTERILPWRDDPRCRLVSGDLVRLPFADRSFEAALCFRILPHLSNWRALIHELCRVSARTVVLEYPSRRSLNIASRLLFRFKRRIESDTREYRLFSTSEIRGPVEASGFTITAAHPQFFFPMVCHRMHGSPPSARVLEAPCRAIGLTRVLGSPVIARAERRQA